MSTFITSLKTRFSLELHLDDKTNLAKFLLFCYIQMTSCKNLLHLKCTSKRYLTLAQQLTWTVEFNRDFECDKYYYDLSPHSGPHFFRLLYYVEISTAISPDIYFNINNLIFLIFIHIYCKMSSYLAKLFKIITTKVYTNSNTIFCLYFFYAGTMHQVLKKMFFLQTILFCLLTEK